MKTFHIRTLGCKVNQCDSQNIRGRFIAGGWVEVDESAGADVCVVNTCCVTHNADRKSRNVIRSAINSNRDSRVVVTGCYADYNRSAIEKINGVGAIFGNCLKDNIYEWAQGLTPAGHGRTTGQRTRGGRTRAFIKIQDGCNNSCSFCVVPLVRGRSRSMKLEAILSQAVSLVEDGCREIVLTGVCLGAYGKDLESGHDLVDVISEIEKIDGCLRIRLSSIEASDITPRIIEKFAYSEKLCPHLHIPFQSGDDRVLEAMNKKMRSRDYRNIIKHARSVIKDLAVTCDVIVGFPFEEDDNFMNTLKFLEEVRPLRTHVFSYSQRTGSSICGKGGTVSPLEAKIRFKKAVSVSAEFTKLVVEDYLGKDLEVLFEYKEDGLWRGYSGNYIRVAAPADVELKNLVKRVKITNFMDGMAFGSVYLNN